MAYRANIGGGVSVAVMPSAKRIISVAAAARQSGMAA
jgi:hypothetical protein